MRKVSRLLKNEGQREEQKWAAASAKKSDPKNPVKIANSFNFSALSTTTT
jgi:hypothetical protein